MDPGKVRSFRLQANFQVAALCLQGFVLLRDYRIGVRVIQGFGDLSAVRVLGLWVPGPASVVELFTV